MVNVRFWASLALIGSGKATDWAFAVAEMSTGEVYKTQREVKVTIGGCGG